MDEAHDGESGLYSARTLDDDVMLPRMDGWKVLRRLRAQGNALAAAAERSDDGNPEMEIPDDYLRMFRDPDKDAPYSAIWGPGPSTVTPSRPRPRRGRDYFNPSASRRCRTTSPARTCDPSFVKCTFFGSWISLSRGRANACRSFTAMPFSSAIFRAMAL